MDVITEQVLIDILQDFNDLVLKAKLMDKTIQKIITLKNEMNPQTQEKLDGIIFKLDVDLNALKMNLYKPLQETKGK